MAEKANEELKKQGDTMEHATGGNSSTHSSTTGTAAPQAGSSHAPAHSATNTQDTKDAKTNAIPPAENGGHDRSVAAHLHEASHLHDNKNAVQHHVPSNKLNEPPQEVSRNGKDHRRQ